MPGRDLVGHLGQLRVGLAQRGRAAAYVVGEQQLAARRRPQPVDASRWCAGRRPRTSGSPRPRRPRTPPAAGARSVGGKTSTMPPRTANSPRFSTRSTRCTPRPRAGVRRRRARRCRPAPARPARGRRGRLTCGCSIERTGATTTCSGPVAASAPGWTQPAQHGQPPADGVAARAAAARAAGSPSSGSRRPRRGRRAIPSSLGQLLGLASGGRDQQDRAPARGPARRPGTAAGRPGPSGRAGRAGARRPAPRPGPARPAPRRRARRGARGAFREGAGQHGSPQPVEGGGDVSRIVRTAATVTSPPPRGLDAPGQDKALDRPSAWS